MPQAEAEGQLFLGIDYRRASICTDLLKVRSRKTMLAVCTGVEALRFEASPKVGADCGNTGTPPEYPTISDMI
jgi:hypothetical protein